MYAIFVNWMRTVVPLAAGWLLTAAQFLGLNPDSTATATLVSAVLTGAYYTVFRIVEHLGDRIGMPALRVLAGVLLGWAKPPETTVSRGQGSLGGGR